MNKKKTLSVMLSTTLCATLLPLAGCHKKAPEQPTVATNPTPTATQPAYVPPTAEQLYQMVGPIALFPDKLVAQVLAGSTYPDQITTADNWLLQNKNLTPAQRQTALSQQPWDVSVKGLSAFPNVVDQMAQNIQWTTALGQAYANDQTDVMNAIQVMRQRATTSGTLKSSKQQKITTTPRVYRTLQDRDSSDYYGSNVITAPQQTIVIEPAEPDVVYVPSYNPRAAYGEPLDYYPGYRESYPRNIDNVPQSGYSTNDLVTAGVITFGVGVAVAALSQHEGGWNSWGVHWGGDKHSHDDRGRGDNFQHDDRDHRPAVVYNNTTYVSRSTSISNRETINNYYNNTNNRNIPNNARPADNSPPPNGNPNWQANRHDHGNNNQQPNFAPQPSQPNAMPANGRPEGGITTGQPNVNDMSRPHFGRDAALGAVAAGATLAAVGTMNHSHTPPNPTNPTPTAPTPLNLNNMSKPNFGHHSWNGGTNNQQEHTSPAETTKPNQNPIAVNPHPAPLSQTVTQPAQSNQKLTHGKPEATNATEQSNVNRMGKPHFGHAESNVTLGTSASSQNDFNRAHTAPNPNPTQSLAAIPVVPASANESNAVKPNFGHHGWNRGAIDPQGSINPVETTKSNPVIERLHNTAVAPTFVQQQIQQPAPKPQPHPQVQPPVKRIQPQPMPHPPAEHVQPVHQHEPAAVQVQTSPQQHPQKSPQAHDKGEHLRPDKKEEVK